MSWLGMYHNRKHLLAEMNPVTAVESAPRWPPGTSDAIQSSILAPPTLTISAKMLPKYSNNEVIWVDSPQKQEPVLVTQKALLVTHEILRILGCSLTNDIGLGPFENNLQ